MSHTPPADPERAFDCLAHALGVASIRALQIEPDRAANAMLQPLHLGTEALARAIERWKASRAFGLDAAGRMHLPDAVDVYVEILRASSPAQMQAASDERLRILSNQPKAQL